VLFSFGRGSGSHQIYCHADGRRVTVTFEGAGTTFTPKTLRSMIEKEARSTEALGPARLERPGQVHGARKTILQVKRYQS